jgi:hypothetical protein
LTSRYLSDQRKHGSSESELVEARRWYTAAAAGGKHEAAKALSRLQFESDK